MADNTKIEWTDATWNVITGCSVISPGCTNCYAMRLAGTRLRNIPSRAGLTRDSKAGPVWNGSIRFNEEWLDQPLQWRRPRMIFVCAHGDLFADGVTDAMLDRVFAVMALAPQHTFQVLTKRPERMRAYASRAAGRIADTIIRMRRQRGDADMVLVPLAHVTPGRAWWPLPNVWLGVSVEDQTRADERIPVLLDTPAAVRWISAEPLLGKIDFTAIDAENDRGFGEVDALKGIAYAGAAVKATARLDWIVAGGESGHGARPMHPDWARGIRDQCAAAGTAFHFKQWGGWLHESHDANGEWDWSDAEDRGILHYWRDDPEMVTTSMPLPKKAAGRLLDGVTHDAFPQVRP